jgi:methanogenic corrinoid protein MtbC1
MRGAAPPLPLPAPAAAAPSSFPTASEMQSDQSFAVLQKRLMGALVAFDQRSAEQVWMQACGLYPTEQICTELLMPVQIAVGEGWHRGEVSVAAEHFCSRFVEGKLLNLLNAYVDNTTGPLAIVGCAQGEMHELGAIMLSLFMRWGGFRVIYLGQNVPNSTIEETIRQLRPQILGLSATTVEAAHNLTETGQIIARIEPPRPHFIFGGMAFYERPDLRGRIHGQFLEGDVRKIVRDMAAQLQK